MSILWLASLSASLAQRQVAALSGTTDHFFLTSDGVRLHYLEAGPPAAHTLVFVPGWTMPAWIWMPQIQAFSRRYHVIAFDPRGQGDSAVPADGYEPTRRGRDIAEMLQRLAPPRVVVVAWSLGVLDTLAAIHVAGDRDIAGLVLVDNSVGEDPPPAPRPVPVRSGRPPPRATAMRQFVADLFRSAQPPAYIDRLTEAALRMPASASHLLRSYPLPRSYWKEALYATNVPVLYAIRPRWQEQGENLLRNRPHTRVEVFDDAGHALFVDDSARFNAVTERFLRQSVWP